MPVRWTMAAVLGVLLTVAPQGALAAPSVLGGPLARPFAHLDNCSLEGSWRQPCSSGPVLDLEYEEHETPVGYTPTELREAYGIRATGGSGQTVAIIIPGDDPNAEADLNTYRSEYSLGECTEANGCFSKKDWKGGTSYPGASAAAAREISLDLDMVSVACQACHILLVEALKKIYLHYTKPRTRLPRLVRRR